VPELILGHRDVAGAAAGVVSRLRREHSWLGT